MNTKQTGVDYSAILSSYDTSDLSNDESLIYDILARLHRYFSERPITKDQKQLAKLGYSSRTDYLEDVLPRLSDDSETLKYAVGCIAIKNQIDI